MKNNILTLAFAICSLLAFAQPDSYLFKRKLNTITDTGYYSISLDPEILARSKSGLNDIRLFSCTEKDSIEIPYLVEWMGNKVEGSSVSFERINDSYNQKCCSYITLKFPRKQIINQIKLDVTDDNFDKRVMVEGSYDNGKWYVIAEHLRIVRLRNGTVDFYYPILDIPDSEYNYFRLKFDDDGSKKITIMNASAFENKVTEGKYRELKVVKQTQKENKKEKISEVYVDFPANYMLSYITLSSKGKTDFYRNINIYRSVGTYKTANGEHESWEAIGSGVISSKEGNKFHLWNSQTKKLKIEIINYDDQPVEISDVKAFSEEIRLLTQLPISDNTWICYGKENDQAPVYDLVHFREKIPTTLKETGYGIEEVKILPLKPGKEGLITNKTWLWVAMVVVILLIGYFALTMLKKENE